MSAAARPALRTNIHVKPGRQFVDPLRKRPPRDEGSERIDTGTR